LCKAWQGILTILAFAFLFSKLLAHIKRRDNNSENVPEVLCYAFLFYFLKLNFNIMLPSRRRSSKRCLSFKYSYHSLY